MHLQIGEKLLVLMGEGVDTCDYDFLVIQTLYYCIYENQMSFFFYELG